MLKNGTKWIKIVQAVRSFILISLRNVWTYSQPVQKLPHFQYSLNLQAILWKFVTSYIIVEEKREKMFTFVISALKYTVAYLHLHSLHCSGEINNNVLKL
jgi:hypothetical protein